MVSKRDMCNIWRSRGIPVLMSPNTTDGAGVNLEKRLLYVDADLVIDAIRDLTIKQVLDELTPSDKLLKDILAKVGIIE